MQQLEADKNALSKLSLEEPLDLAGFQGAHCSLDAQLEYSDKVGQRLTKLIEAHSEEWASKLEDMQLQSRVALKKAQVKLAEAKDNHNKREKCTDRLLELSVPLLTSVNP